MAKKKGKKASKKAAAAAAPKGPVVCFFFFGSIDDLGDELAKFAEQANLADIIENAAAAVAANVSVTKQ